MVRFDDLVFGKSHAHDLVFGRKGRKARRESIPRSLRTELLLRCKGKCEDCHLDFHK